MEGVGDCKNVYVSLVYVCLCGIELVNVIQRGIKMGRSWFWRVEANEGYMQLQVECRHKYQV